MNYPAGLFLRIMYVLSLLGFVLALGLLGSSWAGMVLGGMHLGRFGTLIVLCFVLFRIVQVFRNRHALNVYAPNPVLRFFRGVAVFLMFVNFLLLVAGIFMVPLTNWLTHGQRDDNGMAYFLFSLVLLVGLVLTSTGFVIFEAVRLIGKAHKRNGDDDDREAIRYG